MANPVRAEVNEATRQALARLATGDADLLAQGSWAPAAMAGTQRAGYAPLLAGQDRCPGGAGYADSAPAPGRYVMPWPPGFRGGILGVLLAIAAEVASPKVVTAAPEIFCALRPGPGVGGRLAAG